MDTQKDPEMYASTIAFAMIWYLKLHKQNFRANDGRFCRLLRLVDEIFSRCVAKKLLAICDAFSKPWRTVVSGLEVHKLLVVSCTYVALFVVNPS